MVELKGEMFIAGQRLIGSGAKLEAFDPSEGRALGPGFFGGSVDDVDRACREAEVAFHTFRNTTPKERAGLLEAVASELEAISEPIVERAMAETGLPQARLQGELGRTCGQLRLFARVVQDGGYMDIRVDSALPDRAPPRPDLRMMQVPIGPVAVFGASNFPLAFSTSGGDTASAWAAGCPVVVKAHDAHPGTSELVAQAICAAIDKTGMPEGIFSLLFTTDRAVNAALVAHPSIKAFCFTGSRSGGLALLEVAQKRPEPIPIYAEMSSINPVLLMPHALMERGTDIGKAFVTALTLGAGQFCTNPGLLLAVETQGLSDFEASAAEALADAPAATMLTLGICDAYNRGVDGLRTHKAVRLIQTGKDADGVSCQAHLFAVSAESFLKDKSLQDEVFGAASLLVTCTDLAQMREVLTSLEGQLTISVHASEGDYPALEPMMPLLADKSGRVLFDGFGTGVEVCDAMVHGGPFPSTSDTRTTSVGSLAIARFVRPVCFQNTPTELLPTALRDDNSFDVPRRMNGNLTIE